MLLNRPPAVAEGDVARGALLHGGGALHPAGVPGDWAAPRGAQADQQVPHRDGAGGACGSDGGGGGQLAQAPAALAHQVGGLRGPQGQRWRRREGALIALARDAVCQNLFRSTLYYQRSLQAA